MLFKIAKKSPNIWATIVRNFDAITFLNSPNWSHCLQSKKILVGWLSAHLLFVDAKSLSYIFNLSHVSSLPLFLFRTDTRTFFSLPFSIDTHSRTLNKNTVAHSIVSPASSLNAQTLASDLSLSFSLSLCLTHSLSHTHTRAFSVTLSNFYNSPSQPSVVSKCFALQTKTVTTQNKNHRFQNFLKFQIFGRILKFFLRSSLLTIALNTFIKSFKLLLTLSTT